MEARLPALMQIVVNSCRRSGMILTVQTLDLPYSSILCWTFPSLYACGTVGKAKYPLGWTGQQASSSLLAFSTVEVFPFVTCEYLWQREDLSPWDRNWPTVAHPSPWSSFGLLYFEESLVSQHRCSLGGVASFVGNEEADVRPMQPKVFAY